MDKERATRAPEIDGFVPSVSLLEYSMTVLSAGCGNRESREKNGYPREAAERAWFAVHSYV
jgi:hypothetical protein